MELNKTKISFQEFVAQLTTAGINVLDGKQRLYSFVVEFGNDYKLNVAGESVTIGYANGQVQVTRQNIH